MKISIVASLVVLITPAAALSVTPRDNSGVSRRAALLTGIATTLAAPAVALAAADCMTDCIKECKLIAPKNPEYCLDSCKSYCDQPDRTDGLSGSVSSAGGETGPLGTTTVTKSDDHPPQIKLPGLDFTSDKGKKLLGL